MLISVIVCTHNPSLNLLVRCLDAIYLQKKYGIDFELLVIDNNSAFDFRKQIPAHIRYKYIHEPSLGLSYARLCGIKHSKGDVLCFVDDDNLLADDYLKCVNEIVSDYGDVACFGAGIISPLFETEPDPGLIPFIGSLALRNEIIDHVSIDLTDPYYPYGAGLIVRRDVAIAYCNDIVNSDLKLSLDRKGTDLNSCGDDHFSWIAIRMGFKKGVFTRLRLEHHIPKYRVQKKYLLRLAESYGYSRSLLYYVNGLQFPGLDNIEKNQSLENIIPRWKRFVYSYYRSIIKLFFYTKPSLSSEFIAARNKGVLRFYNTVYLKNLN